jgi:hypothetical protein
LAIPQNGLGWAGAGLGWGLQAVAKQSGRSFLHPAAAAVAMAVGPQPKSTSPILPSSDEINGYLQRRKKGPGKEKEGRTKDKM